MSPFEFISIESTSVRKTIAALRKLRKSVRNNAMKRAAKIGGDIMLAEIRSRAPVRKSGRRSGGINRNPGVLRQSISMRVRVSRGKEARAQIGPSKDAFYALFVEFGTIHAQANPFMRSSFDARVGESARAMSSFFGRFIRRVVRQQAISG